MAQDGLFWQQHPGKLGWVSGYAAAYLFFTTALFFMLTLLEKLPGSRSYFHIMVITALVAILGLAVTRLLK